MKDLLIGMVVGVVTGYVLRKMEDDGKFRCLHANLHHLASKAKEEAMNLKDAGLDKVEYVADRVHQVAHRGSIWFSEYPSSDDRGREASVSDSGI